MTITRQINHVCVCVCGSIAEMGIHQICMTTHTYALQVPLDCLDLMDTFSGFSFFKFQ